MSKQIKLSKSSNYMLILKSELKTTEFYIQRANIPNITQGISEIHHQGVIIKKPGTTFTFNPMNVSIIIDRDFANYEELYNEFTDGHDPQTGILQPSKKEFQVSIVILSNKNNPIGKFTFYGSIITDIGDIDLDSTTTDNLICQMTVDYTYFKFERI